MGCASSAAVAPKSLDFIGSIPRIAPSVDNSTSSSHLDYALGLKIGKGSYAQVHLATHKDTKKEVAVKIRDLHAGGSLKIGDKIKVLKSSYNEVSVWRAIGIHVNCVQLIDSFFDDHLAYMVMEKCTCSLFQYLREHATATEVVFGKAFHEILCGLDHMHSVGVAHRDIKPDNFLVGGTQGNIAKLCDFGLSTMIPESGALIGICGTAPYMPPEMLITQSYNEKADVWSVGAVAYLLLCGTFPYQTADGSSKQMKISIKNGGPARCNRAWLSGEATEFLQKLLERAPEERPTAEMALSLPFFTKPEAKSMPCLHQVLDTARKTGAFDSQNISEGTKIDETLLNLSTGKYADLKGRSFTSANVKEVMKASETKGTRSEQLGLGNSTTAANVKAARAVVHDFGLGDMLPEPSISKVTPETLLETVSTACLTNSQANSPCSSRTSSKSSSHEESKRKSL